MGAIGGIADLKNKEIDFAALNRMRLAMSMRGRKRSSAYIGGAVDMIYNSSYSAAFEEGEDKQPAIFERLGNTYVVTQDSDILITPSVFEAYRIEGIDFIGRLRGGFALALYDGESKLLLLARDRKGKKPLFYRVYKGKIYFSSEIKGITEAISRRVSVSREILSLHLTAPVGVYRASNIFTEISEVLPGECLIFSELGMSRFKYRDLSERSVLPSSKIQSKKDTVLTPYPKEDLHRIEDTLSEALIAFDYPQFDSDMPSLCRLFDGARRQGRENIFFNDSVRRQSISYAYEREDRLGAFYGIRAEGRMSRGERMENIASMQVMHGYLYKRLASLSEAQLSLLCNILGARKLDCLMNRLKDTGENEKDTALRIRILGMMIQTVMWAESRELLIMSTADMPSHSALSMT